MSTGVLAVLEFIDTNYSHLKAALLTKIPEVEGLLFKVKVSGL
jgi:hypothetical protein